MGELNQRQQEAISAPEGPVLVLAGAGSGKTTVLIERIAHLIRDLNYAPWSILAITFTKKAAEELRTRLSKQLGVKAMDVWAFTFHSACSRILRRDIDRLGYGKDFTIYDTDDGARVVKMCLEEMNLDPKRYNPKAVLAVISRSKNENTLLEDKQIAEIYKLYTKKLISNNAVDFDDILLLTVKLFEKNPDILEYYQNKFRTLLVDEYQDTNPLQYKFCSMLSAKSRNIFVVGDDDQSIYRFRGATIENILNFEKEYPDSYVVRLEQNYRSTQHILDAANGLIENNHGRTGKSLWTALGHGEQVSLYTAPSGHDEGAYVADTIVKSGGKYKDYAILYRMNAQGNQIEEALRRKSIPYRIIGGTRFLDRMEIRDMLAYLHVLNNPNDDLRLTRIINTPTRGIGDKTIEAIAAIAASESVSMIDIIRNAGVYPELQRASAALARFYAIIEKPDLPLPELYERLLDTTGYLRALREKGDFESDGRAENILELKSNIAKFAEENPDGTLSEFLESISLAADIENYDAEADAVVLMTIHSAKGLEFPTVFLIGAEEGIFPSMRSFEPAEIEEERRLCYVAITRARRKLHITNAVSRMLFGQTVFNPKSRFIGELPNDSIEVVAEKKPVAAERRVAPSNPRQSFNTYKTAVQSAAAAPAVSFKKGDVVNHKAFGKGVVTGTSPMGGDVLLEVEFDSVGTKRLMQKVAGQSMTK